MASKASLSDVYKKKSNREITLNEFQAQVFEQVIERFKKQGVGGDDIFEDTYVLQKDIAQYITGNVTQGGGSRNGQALETYNFILGIETAKSDPVVVLPDLEEVAEEIVQEEAAPTKIKPAVKIQPERNIPFRDLRDKGRPRRPKTMAEYLKNRQTTRPPSRVPSRPPGKPRTFKTAVPTGGTTPFKFDFQGLRNRMKGSNIFNRGMGASNFGGFGR